MPQNRRTTKIRYIPPSIGNATLHSVTLPLLAMGKLLSAKAVDDIKICWSWGYDCHYRFALLPAHGILLCSVDDWGEPHLWNIRYIPTRLRAHGNKPYRIYGCFRLRPSCSHRHSKSDQKHLDGILTRASEGPAPCSLEIPLPSL